MSPKRLSGHKAGASLSLCVNQFSGLLEDGKEVGDTFFICSGHPPRKPERDSLNHVTPTFIIYFT